MIRLYYPTGRIYRLRDLPRWRRRWSLRYHLSRWSPTSELAILNDLAAGCLIKRREMELALDFLKGTSGDTKLSMIERMATFKTLESRNRLRFDGVDVPDEYIAGLFSADGHVSIQLYDDHELTTLSLAQPSCIPLLERISELHGGTVRLSSSRLTSGNITKNWWGSGLCGRTIEVEKRSACSSSRAASGARLRPEEAPTRHVLGAPRGVRDRSAQDGSRKGTRDRGHEENLKEVSVGVRRQRGPLHARHPMHRQENDMRTTSTRGRTQVEWRGRT